MSAPMKAVLYPQGTRVRIRRGPFPMNPELLGRTGTVVRVSDHRPDSYGVILDHESRVREFDEKELETLDVAGEIEQRGDRGPSVGPGQTRSG